MFWMLSGIIFIHPLQGQLKHDGESYVAKAGSMFVSESEFIERYELTPGLGGRRKAQQQIEKQELIYSLIAEKLLAQEALDRGLDKDTAVQRAITNVRKLLSRDELYRQEIIQKSKVTQKEISIGIGRAQRELLLQYLFFEKEEDARFIRTQLTDANSVAHFHIDSSISVLRDTVTLIWGDADPVLENAAYALKVHAVSSVLPVKDGFYIIALKTVKRSAYFNSLQPNVLYEKVESILRLRKEKERLDEFVHETLKNKIAYGRPEIIRLLSQTLSTIASSERHDSIFTVTMEAANQVRRQCGKFLFDTVVVVGKQSWFLGEILDRLTAMEFNVTNYESRAVFAKLNAQLKIWTQQELLAQEALDRQMDQVPAISRKIEMWREHYLAERLEQIMNSDLKISDGEIWSYMKDRDASLAVPMVRIRELRTASLADMNNALNDLGKTKSLEQTILKWSCDPHAKETGGVTEYFSIFQRQPLGDIAWTMQRGERYGPVALKDGPIFFELFDKKIPAGIQDTGFVVKFNAAKEEYSRLKQRGALNVSLSRLGQKMGFSVYQERLDRIKLTPLPMMTYRILGFGGRMFATPLVRRQVEWLGVDNPGKIPLP
jgi:hypothetical protein